MTKTIYSHTSKELLILADEIQHLISRLDTLTVVRHGQTDWNKIGKFNSLTDIELSSEGIFLCRTSEKYYRECINNQNVIISSPLTRCIQTTEILFPRIDVSTDENIREMDFGGFEGLSPRDIKESNHINDLEAWRSSETDDPILEVETVFSVLKRIKKFFGVNDFTDQSVLLVTHGVFSRILISAAIGLNPLLYRSLRLDNCKCAQIKNENNHPRLILLNSFPASGNDE